MLAQVPHESAGIRPTLHEFMEGKQQMSSRWLSQETHVVVLVTYTVFFLFKLFIYFTTLYWFY